MYVKKEALVETTPLKQAESHRRRRSNDKELRTNLGAALKLRKNFVLLIKMFVLSQGMSKPFHRSTFNKCVFVLLYL